MRDRDRSVVERQPSNSRTAAMKVLLVASMYYPDERGGAERVVRVIAEEISRCANEAVVVCIAKSPHKQRDKIGPVRVIRLPLANIFNPFVAQRPQPYW